MGLPIHISKIVVNDDKYKVFYGDYWEFNSNIEQIKIMAYNYYDVIDILNQFERLKKIDKIMKHNKKIYNNKIIFQKNDY